MDLGKFEIIEEVGKGGFGIVYKALDKVLNRQIALKVLHPELLINPNFILRFKLEAQLSAQLDHPNILPIYEFGEFEGRYYIVMAYMPDGSLKDLLRKEGRLDKQRSLKIFEQICDGMSYAHSQKIIHRDLKPGNILFDSRGNARISDMGFAKLIHSDSSASLSASGGMIGTPSYMAPEIWRGKPATSATDVYSLACVLVEMLTGQPLFGGETTPEIFAKIFEPLQLPDDLPEELKPVLEAALEKNQDERIQTVGEFFEQIRVVELGLKEVEKVELKTTDESKVREEKQTSAIQGKEQSTEIGEQNHSGEMDPQETMRSKSGFAEDPNKDEKKPVLPENKERKGKLGVIAGIALLAIFLGVIIYQIVKRNFPSTAPVIAEVPVTVTAAPTTTEVVLGIDSTKIQPMDGMERVYVPEGDFIMGSDDFDWAKPVRKVYLDAYWIDKHEITNRQYERCVETGECTKPMTSQSSTRGSYYSNQQYDNYPVIAVNWNQAKAYCEWAGGDLPTEAQWEKAARGTEGWKYPWGNEEPDNSYANYNDNIGDTTEVGLYGKGASPYGAMDMAGNVNEWVNDWSVNYKEYDINNPQGSDSGSLKIVRGGSWSRDDGNHLVTVQGMDDGNLQSAERGMDDPNHSSSFSVGFRCVYSTEKIAATNIPVPNEPDLKFVSTQIRDKDKMEQVYVPAGDFIMGSDDSDADSDEKPVRTVYLDAYWIDKYEVTTEQYKKCVDEGECQLPSANFSSYDNYPVRNVSWYDAQTYCKWANNGEEGLPTEAQWEKAARGEDGGKFPWGDQSPDESRAHYGKYWSVGPIAVGSKSDGASPYGAMDMAGNVREWVNDWYVDEIDVSVTKNPKGPESGEFKVLRGGYWDDDYVNIRTTYRRYDNPDGRYSYSGFRCVSSP